MTHSYIKQNEIKEINKTTEKNNLKYQNNQYFS